MIKIAALTPGINVPSSRYRVRQHIPSLKNEGIFVDEYPARINYSSKLPGILGRVRQRYVFPLSGSWLGLKALSRLSDVMRSNRYDAVWLNRVIVSSVFMEKLIRKPLIYDVDDAIWINNEILIGKIAEKSEVIIAGNNYLAEWFGKKNRKVHVIPTAVDTGWFSPSQDRNSDRFNIVWTGSHETIHYLLSIEKPLASFMNTRPDTRLVVISDLKSDFSIIRQAQIEFIKWTPDNEIRALRASHVGIMPLSDSPWEKGKCSFKMLQYMACGLPVIVSPVGMNAEILKKGDIGLNADKSDDWTMGLEYLYQKPDEGIRKGREGREVILLHFSRDVISGLLTGVFKNL